MLTFAPLLVTLLVAPAPQLEDPEAIQLFAEAKAAFDVRDWDMASKKLEQAYLIEPKPHVLYPWAQAERSAGRCDTAIDLYQKFIDSEPPTRMADAARENIARCKEQEAAPPERVEGTDDEAPPTTEGGAEVGEGADVKPGTTEHSVDPAGISLVAIGAVGLATSGALFGVAARQARLTETAQTNSTYLDMRKRAGGLRSGGIAAAAIGGALVIVGAIRLGLVARNRKRTASGVSAWVDGRSAFVVWSGRF